ncbi:serine/threonine-protein kinase [Tengunoibacter tsumagoiensis]|uniref:Protein kinase domain-containing protein n=1 Tax=Tengunoibacter tsumagoiensis TaxID=2014871 RepID=A0A402A9M5_9CHLR|nr:serine/threonine-protein kinase [Tengunoibacter tsumagoiensis]GCE15884.1 hypothetical protein KTT_57430 [Tengunoibacter tsumagoiensis]
MVDYLQRQIGNYQLTRLLGEGSFAEVYLGEHIYLGTHAAIKIIKTQTENYPIDLFYTEARNIARLVHPHIVRVLEFGMEDTIPFLVLDYAPNGTLRQRYADGAIVPLPSIIAYVKQMADALQYAHDEKLVHRDVKPENMLLGRRNEVLLNDFGIALMVQSLQYKNLQDVAGTLHYMAPEQIQGKPQPASDQYSLGVITYEWLTGKRPFDGLVNEIIAQHLAAPPPPMRKKVPTILPAVEQVVMTALEKDPAKRFTNIRAFAVALEQASQLDDTGTRPLAGPASLPSTVGTVTPFLGISVPWTNEKIAITPSASMIPAMPAGSVVCSYQGHTNPISSLSWSPDSMSIMSASQDQMVHAWDAMSGNRHQVYPDASEVVQRLAWSPDGSRLATAGADGIIRVWDFVNNRLLVSYEGHHGQTIRAMAWAPQQLIIASTANNGIIQVWDAVTGQTLTMYRGHADKVNALAWAPHGPTSTSGRGYYIVSGGDDTSVQTWEASTGKNIALYLGAPTKVLTVAWSANVYSSSSVSSSSVYNGSRVACGREDGLIQMWDTTVNREVLNYRDFAPLSLVAWSPDSRRFAYASNERTIQIWDTMTNYKLVTFTHTAPVRTMAWSPNGKYMASGGDDRLIQVWVAP